MGGGGGILSMYISKHFAMGWKIKEKSSKEKLKTTTIVFQLIF